MATIFTSNYSGDYGYLYEFKAEAWESDVNNSANTSKVNVDIYLRRTNVSSNGAFNNNSTGWSITIDGTPYSGSSAWDTRNSSDWKWIGNASKVVTHNTDGSKMVSISAFHTGNSASGASRMGDSSGNGTLLLTSIPRYANFTEHYVSSVGLNSITVCWNTDAGCDKSEYSLNDGSWTSIVGYPQYTITGLNPNTKYRIRTRIKRTDSQLWTESGYIYGTTYDIARISNITNFEHGDNTVISITNPSGNPLELLMKIGDIQILSRTVKTGDNTIIFSDTELDNIYKKYGSSNSLTATFIVSGSGYTNSKNCTVTLKGDQKTIKLNISSSWKRGKLWINVTGTNKKAVIWKNIEGTWKRGG